MSRGNPVADILVHPGGIWKDAGIECWPLLPCSLHWVNSKNVSPASVRPAFQYYLCQAWVPGKVLHFPSSMKMKITPPTSRGWKSMSSWIQHLSFEQTRWCLITFPTISVNLSGIKPRQPPLPCRDFSIFSSLHSTQTSAQAEEWQYIHAFFSPPSSASAWNSVPENNSRLIF